MEKQTDDTVGRRATLSLLAGFLFSVAGLIEILVGAKSTSHAVRPAFIALGAAFCAIGCMWIMIAGKHRKDYARHNQRGSTRDI